LHFVFSSLGVALVCSLVALMRMDSHSRILAPFFYGVGAFLPSICALLILIMLDTRKGFEPRYSRYVAQQKRGSIDKAVNAGVVSIEARVVLMPSNELPFLLRKLDDAVVRSGNEDAPFVRPPLILEDDSARRLYLPVIGQMLAGGSLDPLLGDQTNGILYRVGEPVVFVGTVVALDASPGYRESGNVRADMRFADLDWLAFRGATREEVVKDLQEREVSRVPVIGVVLLVISSLALSALACFRH
jgi:hypothetical protein